MGREGAPAAGAAPPPRVDAEVFDTAQLRTASAPDAGAAAFVSEFVAALAERIDALAAALAADDPGEARKIAHAQKGAALSIGARRMGRIMSDIQDMLDAGDPETAKMFAEVLPDTYGELKAAVEPLCDHYLS